MKITKSRLIEMIREVISENVDYPLWEQDLDENWFTNLKSAAKKAYIKANPNSKYAKGSKEKKVNPVKSGQKWSDLGITTKPSDRRKAAAKKKKR